MDFVAFDCETTGCNAAADRVAEIGAVRFSACGAERGRFAALVDPGMPMPEAARAIHAIGDADLIGAPPAAVVIPAFLAWLGDPAGVTLLAHNAAFDVRFLRAELGRLGRSWPPYAVTCTLALARRRMPHAPDHKLGTLAALLGLDAGGAHRAMADSLMVKGLWLAMTTTQSGVITQAIPSK